MQSGIYQIINVNTREFYIGQTKNLTKREYQHFFYLSKGTHSNKVLQRDFDYYGDVFEFHVVEKCEKELLLEKELKFIYAFNPYYNRLASHKRKRGGWVPPRGRIKSNELLKDIQELEPLTKKDILNIANQNNLFFKGAFKI